MANNDCVTLVPFVHQVGGHTAMMKYDDATVCKPVQPAELQFYKTLSPELAKFTPGFKGVVHVSIQEEDDGSMSLRAYPRTCRMHRQPTGSLPNPSVENEGRGSSTCNPKVHRSPKWKHPQRLEGVDSEVVFADHSGSKMTQINPWGHHLYQRQLDRMHRDNGTGKLHEFILLENLTWQFQSPCILDVKLGTRTYHKDHSEAKRKLHIDRDAATTTATLGLRICGMQVYQPNRGIYKCRNKYDGRRLSKDGLQRALSDYLCDNERVRTELIPSFVEKLNTLIQVISTVKTHTFLSSSLLLIYEGDQTVEPSPKGCTRDVSAAAVDLRIIDFGNTEQDSESFDSDQECNRGCVYGLQNLVRIMGNIEGANSSS
ncbi:inositol hexakisphosphate kinase 3-like [Asterias amurensis]|uniref:inositol hexakisphosphate kinase 3-like n=1 Tax=Asterias amurensis TaxID=7602 RepID=UPI003AB26907